MPIAMDPADTVDVTLKVDERKPAGTQPTFKCRHLTARQDLQVTKLLRAAYEEAAKRTDEGDERANDLLNQALAVQVVGVANMPAGFDPAKADDSLSAAEMWELTHAAMLAVRMDESEQKGLGSQRQSDAEPSAETAEAGV